jgi:hypothetical protein
MKKLTFYSWVIEIFTGRTDFPNHNSTTLLLCNSAIQQFCNSAILQFCNSAILQFCNSTSRSSNNQCDDLIQSRFERDPHTAVQKIAQTYSYSLGIVLSTVWIKSTQELEMKFFHLRRMSINWMPFNIAQDSKSKFQNDFL